ncbi:MAG: hypothetical protein ACI835_002834 [Planctomycetota bacterium]|jgi:hypothetical protein
MPAMMNFLFMSCRGEVCFACRLVPLLVGILTSRIPLGMARRLPFSGMRMGPTFVTPAPLISDCISTECDYSAKVALYLFVSVMTFASAVMSGLASPMSQEAVPAA